MSYLTATTKRPHDPDEWVQVRCDGCGALGPRVEASIPRRGHPPDCVFMLAKQAAGFVESCRPWPYDAEGMLAPTLVGTRRQKVTIHDYCRGCAYKVHVAKLIADLGGPFGPPPDDRHPETI